MVRPSIDPMLTTRPGSAELAAARNSGRHRTVSSNRALTLTFQSLSNASSGYSSSGAPQVAPALFTRMCSRSSRAPMTSISRSMPSAPARLEGTEMHSPNADSSAALASHSAALRAVMYPRQPARTSPDAIHAPIPLAPPVTTATLPLTENSDEMPPSPEVSSLALIKAPSPPMPDKG